MHADAATAKGAGGGVVSGLMGDRRFLLGVGVGALVAMIAAHLPGTGAFVPAACKKA